jgi:hypothetical protein
VEKGGNVCGLIVQYLQNEGDGLHGGEGRECLRTNRTSTIFAEIPGMKERAQRPAWWKREGMIELMPGMKEMLHGIMEKGRNVR